MKILGYINHQPYSYGDIGYSGEEAYDYYSNTPDRISKIDKSRQLVSLLEAEAFQNEIRDMVFLLENKELADTLQKTEIGKRLWAEIQKMHDELAGGEPIEEEVK